MVERYTQGALPSPVVSAPGVAPGAGQAAAEVAKLSTQAVNEGFEYQRSQEQSLAQVGENFVYQGSYALRRLEARHQQAQNLANQQVVNNAQIPMTMSMSKAAAAIKQANPNNPSGWADAYAAQQSQITGGAIQAYANQGTLPNKKQQQLLQAKASDMFLSGYKQIASDGEDTAYGQIAQQAALAPMQASQAISEIPANQPLQDKINDFAGIQTGLMTNMEGVGVQALALQNKVPKLQGYAETVEPKLLAAQQSNAKQFWSKTIAEAPQGDAGLSQLMTMRPRILNEKFKGEAAASTLNEWQSAFSTRENSILQDVKSEGEESSDGIEGYKIRLADAYKSGDQAKVDKLALEAHTEYNRLLTTAKTIENTPLLSPENPVNGISEKVKTARLLQNQKERNQWISGLNSDVKNMYSLEGIQRSIEGFGMRVTSFEQGQVRFAEGQAKQQQFILKTQARQAYEDKYAPLALEYERVSNMAPGKARQDAALNLSDQMRNLNTEAHAADVIPGTRFFQDQQKMQKLRDSSFYKEQKTGGFFGFGAKSTNVPVNPNKAPSDQVQHVQQHVQQQLRGAAVGDSVRLGKQATIPTTNAQESAAVQGYIHEHYVSDLEALQKNGTIKTPAQIAAFKANYIKNALIQVRKQSGR